MASSIEAQQLLKAVDRALPNIQSYLCQVLKQEKLSLEAEALRARYEAMLQSLEKATTASSLTPPTTGRSTINLRHSMCTPENSRSKGNLSTNRRRTESDILCNFSGGGGGPSSGGGSQEGLEVIPEKPINVPEITGFLLCKDDHQRWQRRHCCLEPSQRTVTVYETPEDSQSLEVISLVGATLSFDMQESERELTFVIETSGDISITIPEDTTPTETTSSIRHTFAAYSEGDYSKWKTTLEHVVSRSRPTSQWAESVISSTSLGHDSVFSVSGDYERRQIIEDEDEGHVSDGTIYEDIDELVQQFDITMKETAQAIQLISPKKKNKSESRFFSQSGNKDLTEHKHQLEIGERYEGYLYKRSGSSWKKKWCQLKGCVFCYSKSPEDTKTHDYILLRAEVAAVKDIKKPYSIRLACKGVKEVFLAADEEEDQLEWLVRFEKASQRDDEFPLLLDEAADSKSRPLPEGIYNVPRNFFLDEALYDEPPPELITSGNSMPQARGLYDVPRALLEGHTQPPFGMEYQMSGNPFDIYDVPRSALDPDEETIYDYPLDFDLGDMEIYDYPPDASELGILDESHESNGPFRESGSDSSHSHTPASGEGTSSTGSNRHSLLGSVEDMAIPGLGDGFRSLPHNTSQQVESFLSSIMENRPSNAPSYETGISVSSLEFQQTLMKGFLLRKDRLKWTKCYCLIRNSFFECHKASDAAVLNKPLLKLLLVGSQVAIHQDSKRQWTFQLKHPRREGVLVFAAETEIDYRGWMDAFQNASSIQVQKVSTMDEIRISDSDLKSKWRSLERGLTDPIPPELNRKPSPSPTPNGKPSPTEEEEDTVKTKRRLTWGSKPPGSQSSSHRRVKSGSGKELQRDIAKKQGDRSDSTDGKVLKKAASASAFMTSTPQHTGVHRTISPEGVPCFQGFLRVKSSKDDKWSRYWCVLENLKIRSHYNQKNLTLVNEVSLIGSTVARADAECKRKYSFRVWNSETLQSVYYSAADSEEFTSWFNEVIKGGEPTPGTTDVYYFGKDQTPSSTNNVTSDNGQQSTKEKLPQGVLYQGVLKKNNDKGQWNPRFCRLKETHLYVYYTESHQTPITVLAIQHCTVDKINMPQESEKFTFTVSVKGGKTHVFASSTNEDMNQWMNILQECISKGPRGRANTVKEKPKETRKSPLLASHEKSKADNLISYVPASDLINPVHCGYCDIQQQLKGAWLRQWCVLYEHMLYIYQNQDSKRTNRTVVLSGYRIETLTSQGKKPFGISLSHPENPSFNLAAPDQVDFTRWFMALETSSKSDRSTKDVSQKEEEKKEEEDQEEPIKDTTKVPEAQPPAEPSSVLNFNSQETPLTQKVYAEKRAATLAHFDKRIRKTQKVSQATEQNLNNQCQKLRSAHEKFTEHIKRLQTASNVSETSLKKIKEMKVKVAQIDKILPYLDKYIVVNRQAELQTVAILKESCTVKLRELDTKYNRKGSVPLPVSNRAARQEKSYSMPSIQPVNSLSKPRKSKKGRKSSTENTPEETQSTPQSSDSSSHNEPVQTEPTYDVVHHKPPPQATANPPSEHYVELLHPRVVGPAATIQENESPIQYATLSQIKPDDTDDHTTTRDAKTGMEENEERKGEGPLLFSSPHNGQEDDINDPLTASTVSETSLSQMIDDIFEQFSPNHSPVKSHLKEETSISSEITPSMATTNPSSMVVSTTPPVSSPLPVVETQPPPSVISPPSPSVVTSPPPPPPPPVVASPPPPPPPPPPMVASPPPPPPPPPPMVASPPPPLPPPPPVVASPPPPPPPPPLVVASPPPPPPPPPVVASPPPPPPPPPSPPPPMVASPPPPPPPPPVVASPPPPPPPPPPVVGTSHPPMKTPSVVSQNASSSFSPSKTSPLSPSKAPPLSPSKAPPLSPSTTHSQTGHNPSSPTKYPKPPPPSIRPKPKQASSIISDDNISQPNSSSHVNVSKISSPPPPPKTKPKRPRSVTTPAAPSSNSDPLTAREEVAMLSKTSTLAERMKAFQ